MYNYITSGVNIYWEVKIIIISSSPLLIYWLLDILKAMKYLS